MSTPKLDQATIEKTKVVLAKTGSQSEAARALGIARSTLQARVRAMGGLPAVPKLDGAPRPGRSLADFRSSYDKSFLVPKKLREALTALGDGWEYEMQIARLAGVSLLDLATFRPLFEDHIVVVERTKRAWAGKPSVAAKMRAMI